MLQNLHRALGALPLGFALWAGGMIAAACGGGDDGDGNESPPDGNDDGVECGDGVCDNRTEDPALCLEDCPLKDCGDGVCGAVDGTSPLAVFETCDNCPQDCGECPDWTCGNGTCGGDENCTTCTSDCTCGSDQMCREGTCVSTNPLIDAIPGTWDLLEVDGEPPQEPVSVMLTTDPSQPLCGDPASPPGDACVWGFSGVAPILEGTRLYVPENESGITLEGQVLNSGTRIEYDYSAGPVVENDVVWVKRE